MAELLLLAFVVLVSLFGFVLLFGAPYLPVLRPELDNALSLVDLKPNQHLLELGCGDGRVLLAAARQGLRVTGYELNPALAAISWIRTRRYKSQVRVVWANFWTVKLPPADGVFVFLLPKYMANLDKKITQEYSSKKIKLVSFAFQIPDKPHVRKGGVYLYTYN